MKMVSTVNKEEYFKVMGEHKIEVVINPIPISCSCGCGAEWEDEIDDTQFFEVTCPECGVEHINR